MPKVSRAAPRTSTRTCRRGRASPASAVPRTRPVRIPNGTLTKKTQRHDRRSVRKPPMSGPTTDASPHTDEK